MKTFGVPTLGDSRCVLMDTWDRGWSKQVDRTAEWLLSEGYQPILAHPERSAPNADPHHKYHRNLNRLSKTDVLLQGNLKCFDEGESTLAGQLAHQWLHEGRYDLLALDLHHPESLPPRLAGIDVVRDLVGEATADALITKTPRRLLLGA
jgi:tyrosine-protein phosphatase YwqE